MAMTGNILVTPEKLIETSSEFSSCMNQVQSYVNKFNELSDDIAKIHSMINEHVNDLNEMARVFQDAERKNQEIASALSGNVL